MTQHYSDPEREDDPYALPDLEVFYRTDAACRADGWEPCAFEDGVEEDMSGWYYWYCLPGCLPDSDPIGPFESEAEALEDARERG